jgi:branched-chain amino acid transport system permease protein
VLNTFFQMLITGIALGFVYALIGIEYTIIWNAVGLLNFSHANIITLGAYVIAGIFFNRMGLNIGVSFVLGSFVMIIFGYVSALGIFYPLRKKGTIFTAMATILFGKIMYEMVRLWYGVEEFTVPGLMSGTFHIGNYTVAKTYVYFILISVVVVSALQLFLKYTKTGKAMRCVSQNKEAAELMGIDVRQNICISVIVSSLICMIIGFMIIPLYAVKLTMANTIGLKGFSAGVVGGFGYLPGCILGGMIVGIIESLSVLVIPSVYKDVVSFSVLIVFLLIKPGGILGKHA